MIREARIVQPGTDKVLVLVGETGAPAAAACCSVGSVTMEVSNPRGWPLLPGEAVEISDGLGAMVLAGGSFLLFPAVLFTAGSLVSLPWALAGAVLGLGAAVWYFRSRNLGQYPLVVRRLGPEAGSPVSDLLDS